MKKLIFLMGLISNGPIALAIDRSAEALCETARSAWRQLEEEDAMKMSINGVNPTHRARIINGWIRYCESGLIFDKRPLDQRLEGPAEPVIGPWGSSACKKDRGSDFVVASARNPSDQKPDEKERPNPMKLFLQNAEPPYDNEVDKDAAGGIFKVKNLSDPKGIECPKDPAFYSIHWFPTDDTPVAKGDVYCIRARDGKNFALMRIDTVCADGIVTSYKYNGPSTFFSRDANPAPSSTEPLPLLSKP